jgi:hypothetical protein
MATQQTKQIITYGTNKAQEAFYSVNSKSAYECANAQITRGATAIPNSLQDCFNRFPAVKDIADAIGFTTSNMWNGTSNVPSFNTSAPEDLYFNTPASECSLVNASPDLGGEWMGCIWGTPSAPYSCVCPEVRPKYEAYIKHRLNCASFWNTPVKTPVHRAEFVDALQYGRKLNVTIAGDFNLKVGQVVNVRLNGISGYPYSSSPSFLNGLFYIVSLKHVVTNSGTHETFLELSQIAGDFTGMTAGVPIYP